MFSFFFPMDAAETSACEKWSIDVLAVVDGDSVDWRFGTISEKLEVAALPGIFCDRFPELAEPACTQIKFCVKHSVFMGVEESVH